MGKTIDYFYSHLSPWVFLGHQQLLEIAARTGATVAFHPVSVAEIFPKTGGLPLAKRAPERQAYRLVELKRWSKHLGMPMNLEPKHFPVDDKPSMMLGAAAAEHGVDLGALSFAVMKAVWQEERDVSDWNVLRGIAESCGVDRPALIAAAQREGALKNGLAECQAALNAGCFGVPWYAVDGEGFWGQDRLAMLEKTLQQSA